MTTYRQLEELSYAECLGLLRDPTIGRIALVVDEFPLVVPVSFTFVETSGRTWIAFRSRDGSRIERGSGIVAFQVDSADEARREGWSVLVVGTLHRVDPDAAGFRERFDPHPWVDVDCDVWFIVEPIQITGRRVRTSRPSEAAVAR